MGREKKSGGGRLKTSHERSGGVIVYRVDEGVRLYLLLDYGRYWDFAKGHLEKGEDDRTAALRELREETGITQVDLVAGFKKEIKYYFRKKEVVVRKEVCFFAGRTEETGVTLSDEHVGWAYLPYEAAMERLKYESARDVLEAVETYLAAS